MKSKSCQHVHHKYRDEEEITLLFPPHRQNVPSSGGTQNCQPVTFKVPTSQPPSHTQRAMHSVRQKTLYLLQTE